MPLDAPRGSAERGLLVATGCGRVVPPRGNYGPFRGLPGVRGLQGRGRGGSAPGAMATPPDRPPAGSPLGVCTHIPHRVGHERA